MFRIKPLQTLRSQFYELAAMLTRVGLYGWAGRNQVVPTRKVVNMREGVCRLI